MNIHFYKQDDIQGNRKVTIDNRSYPFSFIVDVPGDNPDVLEDYDNNVLADKLTLFGAIGRGDKLDCESCCFYIYFKSKGAGLTFIKKLNDYLSQKARLIRQAAAF